MCSDSRSKFWAD